MVPNLIRAQGTCTFHHSHTHTHPYLYNIQVIKPQSSRRNNLSYITCINLTHQCYDTHHYISKGLKEKTVQCTQKAEIGHNSWQQQKHPELYSDLLVYPTAALPALWALDFGRRACCCMQLSNSNSPLACVIWRCITMRRHLSSKSSSSFAFFRQSRMSGSVDVGSQCFCRIKPEHYRCTDKTSYGKLQASEINTQPQT